MNVCAIAVHWYACKLLCARVGRGQIMPAPERQWFFFLLPYFMSKRSLYSRVQNGFFQAHIRLRIEETDKTKIVGKKIPSKILNNYIKNDHTKTCLKHKQISLVRYVIKYLLIKFRSIKFFIFFSIFKVHCCQSQMKAEISKKICVYIYCQVFRFLLELYFYYVI